MAANGLKCAFVKRMWVFSISKSVGVGSEIAGLLKRAVVIASKRVFNSSVAINRYTTLLLEHVFQSDKHHGTLNFHVSNIYYSYASLLFLIGLDYILSLLSSGERMLRIHAHWRLVVELYSYVIRILAADYLYLWIFSIPLSFPQSQPIYCYIVLRIITFKTFPHFESVAG